MVLHARSKETASLMSAVDTRHISRDSLFLLAELRRTDAMQNVRVKVRNLSTGGMMAEGEFTLRIGDSVTVRLKNIGDVRGTVAWVQDNRCGIAFAETIDPKQVTAKSGDDTYKAPDFVRQIQHGRVESKEPLRKI